MPSKTTYKRVVKSEEAKLGGKIHKILNKTLYTHLKWKEYKKLVTLIAEVFALPKTSKKKTK